MMIIKRHTGVSIMILLCFFSAFLALCNGLSITAHTTDLIKEENDYAYAEEMVVTIRAGNEVTAEELLSIADSAENCNIFLENMLIWFEEVDGVYYPNIILKQNEPLSIPTDREIARIPENGIVAPSDFEIEELTVHENKLRIIEKIDCEKYPFASGSITLNGNDYFGIFPNALKGENTITIRIASNVADAKATYLKIKETAEKVLSDAVVSGSKTDSKTNVFSSSLSMENIIAVGLFLFALINTVVISYYWVNVRRREIAIRKAFGATDLNIATLIMRELFALIGSAAVLASVVQIIIWIAQGDEINIRNSSFLGLGLLFAMIAATVFTMIVPVKIILKIQPSEGVKM